MLSPRDKRKKQLTIIDKGREAITNAMHGKEYDAATIRRLVEFISCAFEEQQTEKLTAEDLKDKNKMAHAGLNLGIHLAVQAALREWGESQSVARGRMDLILKNFVTDPMTAIAQDPRNADEKTPQLIDFCYKLTDAIKKISEPKILAQT